MNITHQKSDAINGRITVEISPEDYQFKVEKSLNDIRKNAVFAGFRKGNVPKSHIVAKYRKTILLEEINKLVQEHLLKYIQDNKLNILGEPIPYPKGSTSLEELETQETFHFVYEVGFMPEVNIKLTKDDKIPYYVIAVPDSFVEKQIENYKANYGTHIPVDAAESTDLVKGNMVEQDGSLTVDSAILMPFYMKDETEREKFIDAKIGDVIVFNPYTAYEGQA
jgi:trigger factor